MNPPCRPSTNPPCHPSTTCGRTCGSITKLTPAAWMARSASRNRGASDESQWWSVNPSNMRDRAVRTPSVVAEPTTPRRKAATDPSPTGAPAWDGERRWFGGGGPMTGSDVVGPRLVGKELMNSPAAHGVLYMKRRIAECRDHPNVRAGVRARTGGGGTRLGSAEASGAASYSSTCKGPSAGARAGAALRCPDTIG